MMKQVKSQITETESPKLQAKLLHLKTKLTEIYRDYIVAII